MYDADEFDVGIMNEAGDDFLKEPGIVWLGGPYEIEVTCGPEMTMAMLLNVIAATHKIDRATLERLRIECVKEVKRTNGNFTLDDAVDWQEGDE